MTTSPKSTNPLVRRRPPSKAHTQRGITRLQWANKQHRQRIPKGNNPPTACVKDTITTDTTTKETPTNGDTI